VGLKEKENSHNLKLGQYINNKQVMSNGDGFMQAYGTSHNLVVFCIGFGFVFGC